MITISDKIALYIFITVMILLLIFLLFVGIMYILYLKFHLFSNFFEENKNINSNIIYYGSLSFNNSSDTSSWDNNNINLMQNF